MKKKLVAYFDCDGVLVDYLDGFMNYCREQGDPVPPGVTSEDSLDYDLYQLGWWNSKTDMFLRMHNFCYSQYWANPRCLISPDLLLDLRTTGVELHCITLVSDLNRHDVRTELVNRYFGGVFKDIIFTDHNTSKADTINERTNGMFETAVLVEDNLSTIEEAASSPIIPILVDQPYNRRTTVGPAYTRVATTAGAAMLIHDIANG